MEAATSQAITDIHGSSIFGAGDCGAAHVAAHRALDEGRSAHGHEALGRWLAEQRRGSAGPAMGEYVHLQWHMLVFELASARWESARSRFQEEILPVATASAVALTDGPSGLWRLHLAAPRPARLPWGPIADLAHAHLGSSPYVELHHLLAFAGAGDTGELDRWIAQSSMSYDACVVQWAWGLRALAGGDHAAAAVMLADAVPEVARLGGSRAQNELFSAIRDYAERLAAGPSSRRAA